MAKQLVLAYFDAEGSADSAVEAIKAWDKAEKEIKLGAIGVLVKDEQGKVKTHKLGKRHTGTGAVLLGVAAMLSGGLTVLGGAVLGGLVGFFFHKGLGMKKDDIARLSTHLDGGKAAVGVLAKEEMAQAIAAKLTELGGVVETYEVSEEAEAHVEEAVAEIEEAVSEAGDEAADAAEAVPA
jgi:uncharacterized membrane protein